MSELIRKWRGTVALWVAPKDGAIIVNDASTWSECIKALAMPGVMSTFVNEITTWLFPEPEPNWGEGEYVFHNGDWVRPWEVENVGV